MCILNINGFYLTVNFSQQLYNSVDLTTLGEDRMLKNYTVIIKNVKVGKQNNMIKYLTDAKHKNHVNTTFKNATEIDEETYKENLLKKVHQQELAYMKNAKGGRKLKRIAKSITFNLPKDYDATPKQVISINLKLLEEIEKLCWNIHIDLTKNDLYSIIHYEEKKQDHVNLILPTIDNQGKNIRHFNSPAFAKQIKVLFTEIVDNTLNTDIKQYTTLTPEQQAHNNYLRDIERLKADYEAMLQTDLNPKAISFLENEIIKINRTLEKNTPETIKDYMKQLNKSVDKVNKAQKTGTVKPLTM